MSADDRVLRAAEEFEAIAKRHGLILIQNFGDLFEAFEIAVSRTFGTSVQQLARQEELRLIREIHQHVVLPIATRIDTTQIMGATTK